MKYRITLLECENAIENYWRWAVYNYDGGVVVQGQAMYRLTAKWLAQRAARRHAKGLPLDKLRKPPQNDYIYEV